MQSIQIIQNAMDTSIRTNIHTVNLHNVDNVTFNSSIIFFLNINCITHLTMVNLMCVCDCMVDCMCAVIVKGIYIGI